jgi:hypothetical protein
MKRNALVAALIAMGLGGALASRSSKPPPSKSSRTPADIARRKARQAAKRARRAARAGHKVAE